MSNQQSGFSLLEVLISVAIIGMLTMVTLPVYESFSRRNDLDIAAQQVADTLRRASVYSRATNYDSAWSVEVLSNSVTLLRGTSHNAAYDEAFTLPGTVTASGSSLIQFSKTTGKPTTTATVTLTSTTNEIKVLNVNAVGMVSY